MESTCKGVKAAIVFKNSTAVNTDEAGAQNRLVQLRERIKKGTIPQPIVEELTTMLGSLGIVDRPHLTQWKAGQKEKFERAWAEIEEKVPHTVLPTTLSRGFTSRAAWVFPCHMLISA